MLDRGGDLGGLGELARDLQRDPPLLVDHEGLGQGGHLVRVLHVVLPVALWGEKTGTFTNADRTVHLSLQAVDPPGDARSDVWFTVHLGLRLKELYKDSPLPRDGGTYSLNCAVIVKTVDEQTRRKVGINSLLRDL